MGWDTYGVVEIFRDSMWCHVISVSCLIEQRDPKLLRILFGVAGGSTTEALVGVRGFPHDVSNMTIYEFHGSTDPPTSPDRETAFPTWVTWDELANYGLSDPVLGKEIISLKLPGTVVNLDAEWTLLLKMMTLLAEHFGQRNVRLIAWFSY